MSFDDLPEDEGAPAARPSRMRSFIAAGLMGVCLLGMLGGMLHILPA